MILKNSKLNKTIIFLSLENNLVDSCRNVNENY